MLSKLSFSGHDSFPCKQFWLKKVFDFSKAGNSFIDELAVVELGVGKNMVSSMRYWGKSFGIIDNDDTPTEFGDFIFSDSGKDPFLEDIGTIWLLHYNLIKTGKASIYSFLFNEFRKERLDFTKEQFHFFLQRKCDENSSVSYNENTINTDINVLLRNYSKSDKDIKVDIEDVFSNLFLDLNLIKHYQRKGIDEKLVDYFQLETDFRSDIPFQIILFAILDSLGESNSIGFRELQIANDSPGTVFLINADGLYEKIEQITDKYKDIVYSETAGNQVLQFKKNINKWEVLNEYYNQNI
jgi:hypothetical protein